MYKLFILSFFVCGAFGQLLLTGNCNYASQPYVKNVNITQMFGNWHQIARIKNADETGDCSSLTINGTYANTTLVKVNFYLSQVFNKSATVREGIISSSDILEGLYVLNFSDNVTVNFVVKSIDYTKHAVLYSCIPINTTNKLVWAWQYHRSTTLTSSEQASLYQIAANGTGIAVNSTAWKVVDNSDSICKNNAVSVASLSHVFTIVAFLFIGKECIVI